jgi:hypothetical protein
VGSRRCTRCRRRVPSHAGQILLSWADHCVRLRVRTVRGGTEVQRCAHPRTWATAPTRPASGRRILETNIRVALDAERPNMH